MSSLLSDLENLVHKIKGLSDLISAISSSENSFDSFKDGIYLLSAVSYDYGKQLEELWREMHLLNKNNKTSKGGDAA